jgi:hypothetical protein
VRYRTSFIVACLLLVSALPACGGDDRELASEEGPSCRAVWDRTLSLIQADPDMSRQWAGLSDWDRSTRGQRAIVECEAWAPALRQCYVDAKSNLDLARCEDLRGVGRQAHRSATDPTDPNEEK